MIRYICDVCGMTSEDKDDVPTYTMFVCDTYDGEEVSLCVHCENDIKNKWKNRHNLK